MEYLKHLINWTRLKSAGWIFLAGVIASVLYQLQSANILTITWGDLKYAIVTAIISQVTKSIVNYQQTISDSKSVVM